MRPGGISNKLLKEFAPEFTPIIKDIYNQSLGPYLTLLKGQLSQLLHHFQRSHPLKI